MAKRKKKSKLQRKREDSYSAYWRRRADMVWRQRVLGRAGHRCAICGAEKNGSLNVHHLLDRSLPATRYALENGLVLCPKHHRFDRAISAHKGSIAFCNWLITNRPHQWAWLIANLPAEGQERPKIDYQKAYNKLQQGEVRSGGARSGTVGSGKVR